MFDTSAQPAVTFNQLVTEIQQITRWFSVTEQIKNIENLMRGGRGHIGKLTET